MEKLKIVELFGGIGAIRKALINKGIECEVIDYVEIDKNCVKSYNALYGEDYMPRSVVNYHLPREKIDILMHGSPCQDFSRAGEKRGGIKGSGTRSSLLFETIRIIEYAAYKPTWVIWENVKGVLDRNMRDSFFYYLNEMKRLGWMGYTKLDRKNKGRYNEIKTRRRPLCPKDQEEHLRMNLNPKWYHCLKVASPERILLENMTCQQLLLTDGSSKAKTQAHLKKKIIGRKKKMS